MTTQRVQVDAEARPSPAQQDALEATVLGPAA